MMLRRRHLGAAAPVFVSLAVGLSACGGAAARAAYVTVRTCSEVGSGGLAADYRERALALGPLALSNLRTYEAGQPLPGHVGKRCGAYEIIAVVRHGTKVTVRLPRSEWATVGLLYDPSKFRDDGAYLIKDMAQVARVEACKPASFNHGVSQFDGGFVVTRPQCVHFSVTAGRRTYAGEFPAAAACKGWRPVRARA
jgi:hypothetical protein